MRRKFVFYSLFLFFLFFSLIPSVLAETPSIHVTIEEGFGGMVKHSRAYPMKITLENNGSDFNGDLLINFLAGYNLGGKKVIKVELPEGSKKTYEVLVPAITYDYYRIDEVVSLYETSWKNGKKIPVTGNVQSVSRKLDPYQPTLGVLSSNPDRMKNLQLMRINGEQAIVVNLSKDTIPEHLDGLDFFDFIFVDDFAISELSEGSQKALLHWIDKGGVLVVGASSKGIQAFGKLGDSLPLKGTSKTTVTDLAFFEAYDNQLPFDSITILVGELQENSEVIEYAGEHPVVVRSPLGKGMIVQTAFSLGEAPLATWSEYDDLMTIILTPYLAKVGQRQDTVYQEIFWGFGSTNEYFPNANFSLGIILLIMIAYILIIAPIMYAVLHKVDKREHLWWIIPALSILFSVGIFGIGAKDRIARPQLSEMGLFKVDENGDLTGNYAATLFSNKSGDYELALPGNIVTAVPVLPQDGLGRSSALIYETRTSTEYYFPDVEYWSSRTVLGNVQIENNGSFQIDLKLKDKQLVGTIENLLPYDFEEVYIWSGIEVVELGALKKNEVLQVEASVQRNLLTRPIDGGPGMNYNHWDEELEIVKKANLQSDFLYNETRNFGNNPVVIGFTSDPIVEADILNKTEKVTRIQMIYQPFNAEVEISGEFTITNEEIETEVRVIQGTILDPIDRWKQIGLDKGEYEIILSLPEQLNVSKATFESISYQTDGFLPGTLFIYDIESSSFIELFEETQEEVLTDRPERFITENGEIILKFITIYDDSVYFPLPQFTIKGAVNE